jgi:hypothetical protein
MTTRYAIPPGVTSIGNSAFNGCDGLTEVTIPSGVTSIGNSAFASCSGLTQVTIPVSVTSIGGFAFSACSGLVSVAIPEGLTSIAPYIFYLCSSLTSVTIPGSVKTIETAAFRNCSGLTSVSIPAGVTSLASGAFHYCGGLKSAIFMGSAPTMGGSVFDYTASGFTVFYFNGKTGFSSPRWYGYPAVNMGDSSPFPPWLLTNGFAYNTDLQSDPDGDKVSLLMAYALNLDPKANLSGLMPRPVIAANRMSLTFYTGSIGINYSVEASDDLRDWSTAGVILSAPDANQCRTATANMTGSSRFLRLVVGY